MSSTTVAEFATELKKSTETLLEQLKSAGVTKSGASDKLTDADKQLLLNHFHASHGTSSPERRKITLVKKSTSEIKQADSSGKVRTIPVVMHKKRTFVRREDGVEVAVDVVEVEHEVESAPLIDNVELARREEEARRQAELIRRQEEELSERRRQREEQEIRTREAEQAAVAKAAEVAAKTAEEQALKEKNMPVAPVAQAQDAMDIAAAKVLEATEKAEGLAKAKVLASEKAAADSKARAAEDVARAADLGDRRRKAEAEAAAIRLMMSSPAKKAPPPPKKPEEIKAEAAKAGIKGTLHKPAAGAVPAKPAKPGAPGA